MDTRRQARLRQQQAQQHQDQSQQRRAVAIARRSRRAQNRQRENDPTILNFPIAFGPLEPWTRDDKRACVNSKHNNTRTNHSSVEPSPSPGALAVRRIGNARTMPSALAVSAIENASTTPGAPAISRIENAKTTPGALAVSKIGTAKTRPGARSIDRTGNSTTPCAEIGCLPHASLCVLFRSRTSSRKNGPGTSSLCGPSVLPATPSSGQVQARLRTYLQSNPVLLSVVLHCCTYYHYY